MPVLFALFHFSGLVAEASYLLEQHNQGHMSHLAEQLKEKGNAAFKDGDYQLAEDLYTQAVQKYSKNHLIFTNSEQPYSGFS